MMKLNHKPAGTLGGQEVDLSLLKANDLVAEMIRREMKARGTLLVNLVSSPGSGKTSLLEETIRWLRDGVSMAVLEGDLETERDAQRIRALGAPALQIATGGVCHLEAQMVMQALPEMDLDGVDILFIENVENLVCPVSYDLGEDIRIILLSCTEGDDKPKKYPGMFLSKDVMVITKTDLLPYVPFSVQQVSREAKEINGQMEVMLLSSQNGDGIGEWCGFLLRQLEKKRKEQVTVV